MAKRILGEFVDFLYTAKDYFVDPKGNEYASGSYLEKGKTINVEGFFDKVRKSWTWMTEDEDED